MYLLDTCVIIDFLKGKTSMGLEVLRNCNPADIKIPSIVEAELYVGLEKSKASDTTRKQLEAFLAPFDIVSFDSECAKQYAKVRAYLESEGTPIGGNDTLIAAMALALDATLVTHNEKEFSRIPYLRLEYWFEGEAFLDKLGIKSLQELR